MKVYVSGPITNPDPTLMLKNCQVAMEAGCRLFEFGHEPFVPHTSYFMHLHAEATDGCYVPTWQDWIRFDLAILSAFVAMVRLPGTSKGAAMEEARAKELGIPVFYSVEDFLTWANKITHGH